MGIQFNRYINRQFKAGIIGFIVSIYILFIWTSYVGNNEQTVQEGYHTQRSRSKQYMYGDKLNSRMRMELWINHVDTANRIIKAKIFFFPTKYLVSEESFPGISKPLIADFKYQRILYPAASLMKPTDIVFPMTVGSNFYYPFNTFDSEINLKVISVEDNVPIPIKVDMLIITPGLWFDVVRFNRPIRDDPTAFVVNDKFIQHQLGIYQFKLSVSRSLDSIVFSLGIVIIMWVMTITYLFMMFRLVYTPNLRPSGSYLGLGPTLLFAMPILRYIQPSVPPIGTLMDFIGFFW